MDIASCRNRLEQFHQGLCHELYLTFSGRKSRLELVRLYADYSDFFCRASIQDVESALETEPFESRRKSLEKIMLFLMGQFLDFRTAPASEEIDRSEAAQTFSWDGRDIPVSGALSLLRGESDALRRRMLHERHVTALGESAELKWRRIVQRREAAAELGFSSYAQAKERICGIQYGRLLDAFEEAMRRLEDKSLERIRQSFEVTLGIPFQEAGSWDAARWEEANDKPHVFGERDLIAAVNATIGELGLRSERSEAVSLDLEPRIGKRGSAQCIPIRVPQEIRIIMVPGDGSRHYAALLHESGHAFHFAWTSASLPPEHRILGDRGLCECYAFLLEHFLREPQWLARMLQFTKSGDFIRFQALLRVFRIRICTAKLRAAIQLYEQGSSDDAAEACAETMRLHTGLRYIPGSWLCDQDDGFASADYLKGWALEAMLREYLKTRYGNSWASSRSASVFLKELWETGMFYSSEELCREIGIGDLEPGVLADQLWEGLQY